MASYREEEDPFEEDIVFDQAGLLSNTTKMNTAIRRVSSGKCALFAKTLGLCGAFFGLGLCIAIPGPSFLSPVTELQAGTSPISSIYAARTSGYLVGSIIGGFLFDYFNRLFLLFISLLLTAVFITVTPWCQILWLLQMCMVFLGMSMGFLDTGGNVLCLDLWGRNSGPFMQALHFSFGLGAFVAPLLAAPFFEPIDVISTTTPYTTTTMLPDIRGKREVQFENITENFDDTQIFLHSTSKSLDNITLPSNHLSSYTYPSINGNITLKMPVYNVTNRLEITATTMKPPSTTQRHPKRKSSALHASKLESNYENVGSQTPSRDDMMPVPSTPASATDSLSTKRSYGGENISYKPDATKTQIQDKIPSGAHLGTTFNTSVEDSMTGGNHFPTSVTSVSSPASLQNTNVSSSKLSKSPEQVSVTRRSTAPQYDDHIPTTTFMSVTNVPPKLKSQLANLTDVASPTSESIPSSLTFKKLTENYTNTKLNPLLNASYMERKYNLDISVVSTQSPEILQTSYESVNNADQKTPRTIAALEDRTSGPTTHFSWIETTSGYVVPQKHIHHKPHTIGNGTEDKSNTFDTIASIIEKYGFTKVQFTYLLVGLFVFAISLVFLGFLCHNPRDPKSKQEEGQGAKKISNKTLHALLISLMAIFFFLYVGLEVTYGQLVLAFAVHGDLQLARSTGLVIAVVFWGSFAAMRFASIFFSSCFGPITMLLLNFVFCTLGTVLLSSMASQTETALWVGTVLLGVGLASVFPSGILWIERYIHISNKVAAAFVMGASLGEIVCPIAVYQLMVNNRSMLMHSAVVINVLCILTFIGLRWLALRHGEKYCTASNNGYQLANQDEEEDMIDMSPSGSVMALRRHSFSSEHRALLNGNPHRGP